jgi:hypothetical protein
MKKTKAQRRAWWASLSPEEQDEYIVRAQERKAASPNAAAREASARLDLATERGCFMSEIPDVDVAEQLRTLADTPGRESA